MIAYVRPGSRARVLAGDTPHWVRNSRRSRYIISVLLSAPPWVDRKALVRLAERAQCLTELTGTPHVLDHIVPLNHPRVCGLTVPWNLRIITAAANGHKSNRLPLDGQLELFETTDTRA